MRRLLSFIASFCVASLCYAQTSTFSQYNPKRATLTQLLAWLAANDIVVTGDWAFTAAILELPNSATLPGTCDVGDMYMDTDATTGQRFYLCESANAWVVQGDGGSSGDRVAVSQTTHGFSVGEWIMHSDASDAWELLDSSAVDSDNHAVGFVSAVADVNNFTVAIAGSESWSHGLDIGPLYASSTPGTLTDTTPPLGEVEWLVAVASSSGVVVIMQREWIQL
jgi:hypothetical protein